MIKGESMLMYYKNYLSYELPNMWCVEENNDNLTIYNPNGKGAMIVSCFNVLSSQETIDEQISIMTTKFIKNNRITLQNPLILHSSPSSKTVLFGEGNTCDHWFVKLWIIAKYPKIVFITYQSENKTKEIKMCDKIVNSMNFLF